MHDTLELPRLTSSDFLAAETFEKRRVVVPSPVSSARALMAADAVPVLAPISDERTLEVSTKEAQVLAFVDGKRPIARIAHKAGLAVEDLHVVIGKLATRGIIHLAGVAEKREVVIRPALRAAEPMRRNLSGARPQLMPDVPRTNVSPRDDASTEVDVSERQIVARPVAIGIAHRSPRELMKDVADAETAGDFPRAEKILRAIVERSPESAVAHAKLAIVLAKQKRLRAAYDEAVVACELAPENATYRANMVKLLGAITN